MESSKGDNILQQFKSLNESNWRTLAEISESLDDKDKAIFCYENAINNNPSKIHILNKLASIYQEEDKYEEAIKYLKRIIQANNQDFDAWSNLGHCYLMMEDLKKAQSSYQQAFQFPNSNNDPNLLYGIGILYARMNNLDYAQQLFEKVIQINETTNKFEKINELCFRLGIVHKQKGNYDEAMRYFQMIGDNPPVPLSIDDIKFQKGHIFELQKNIVKAKEIYDEILQNNPNNSKVHLQIGWLYYHNPQLNPQNNNAIAIQHLQKAISIDSSDAQTWYLLGRCQMALKEYNRAYEAYQHAVERDGTNPAFWCSIGVLFFQINQYNDALNAYTKAIELDPNFSEVWYDLGTLYESCNQIDDSLGAYQKASELDPSNVHIRHRLNILRKKYENKGEDSPNSMVTQDNGNGQMYMEQNGMMNNQVAYMDHNGPNHTMQQQPPLYNDNNYVEQNSTEKKRKLEKEVHNQYPSSHKKLKDGDEAYTPKNDEFSESTESSEINEEQPPPTNNVAPNYYNQDLPTYEQQGNPQQPYGNMPIYNYQQNNIYDPQQNNNAQYYPPHDQQQQYPPSNLPPQQGEESAPYDQQPPNHVAPPQSVGNDSAPYDQQPPNNLPPSSESVSNVAPVVQEPPTNEESNHVAPVVQPEEHHSTAPSNPPVVEIKAEPVESEQPPPPSEPSANTTAPSGTTEIKVEEKQN